MPFRGDCKGSCPAADIEDGFAKLQPRQAEHLLTKDPLPAEHGEPHQPVVANCRMEHRAACAGRPLSFNCLLHIPPPFLDKRLKANICPVSSVDLKRVPSKNGNG